MDFKYTNLSSSRISYHINENSGLTKSTHSQNTHFFLFKLENNIPNRECQAKVYQKAGKNTFQNRLVFIYLSFIYMFKKYTCISIEFCFTTTKK